MANRLPRPTETALIVPIPEADPLVGQHRERMDPAAEWGIPTHVTVLYPFVSPAETKPEVSATVAEAIRSVGAFDCRFARTRWFGDEVLWLAPEPVGPFLSLIATVCIAFPGCPPYGGSHSQIVPHLTIGQRPTANTAELQAAEAAVRTQLPVTAHVDRVLLVAGSDVPHSWQTLAEFRLGAPD